MSDIKNEGQVMNRRSFLKFIGLGTIGALVTACDTTPTALPASEATADALDYELQVVDTMAWRADQFEKVGYNAEGVTEAIKQASVSVEITGNKNGSGTMVRFEEKVVILTAGHVTDGLDLTTAMITLNIAGGADGVRNAKFKVARHQSLDVAVLIVDQSVQMPGSPIDSSAIDYSLPNKETKLSGIFFPVAADSRAVPVSPPVEVNWDLTLNLPIEYKGNLGFDSKTESGGSGAGLFNEDKKLVGILVGKQRYEKGTPLDQQKRSYFVPMSRIGKDVLIDLVTKATN